MGKGLEVNVTGMILIVKICLPGMRKSELGEGNICEPDVHIGSVASQGGTHTSLNSTSEEVMVNMTKVTAAHYGQDESE